MEARIDKVETRIDKVEAQMVELSRIIDTGFQAIPEQLRVELSSFRDEVMEALGLRRSAPMVVAQAPGQDVQIPSEELVKITGDSDVEREKQLRKLQLRKMLELLVHASRCRTPQCQYPNCRKVKGLFQHGIQCKRRSSGGCLLCKKLWYLLQLHARACQESVGCHVPRCRDLKEHLRRLQQQQAESRRRAAAVMEMMRQNAAGNSA